MAHYSLSRNLDVSRLHNVTAHTKENYVQCSLQ